MSRFAENNGRRQIHTHGQAVSLPCTVRKLWLRAVTRTLQRAILLASPLQPHTASRSQPRPNGLFKSSSTFPRELKGSWALICRETRLVMRFSQVVKRIETLRPECSRTDVAHLSVLALHIATCDDDLVDDERLAELITGMSLRLNQASDQHAAVTDELRELAQSDPKEFKREQIWTLIRAINVQDQLLQMYAGLAPLDA